MVLPLLKLGILAVRTLSKPFATRLKKQAAYQPKFREFILRIAQANHRFQTQVQRWISSHSTDVAIQPLNEEKAIQAAADLIGELFVFTVGGAVVVFEVQRSARSEAKKEEIRKQELEAMRQRENELAKELELLMLNLKELEQLAKGKGLSGLFYIKNSQTEGAK